MVSRNDYGMCEQGQSFHVGDRGSNPLGDATTYDDSTKPLTPQSPQKSEGADLNPDYLAFVERQRAWDARAKTVERGPDDPANDNVPAGQYRSERRALKSAINRCHCPTGKDFADYGGRGITKGYEPGNVRWATWVQQANNRRSSRVITWRGESNTAAEWARKLGMRRQDVANRLNKGEPLTLVLCRQPTDADLLEAAAEFIEAQHRKSSGCAWKPKLIAACRRAARQEIPRRKRRCMDAQEATP